jgi:GntR family transcriptional regulator / MocR family aminotransferase
VHTCFLNYGDPMGSWEFREVIAAYLRTARAVRCDAGQIMIVSGSQQGLDICSRVLLNPGDPVWIEDPGYSLLRAALNQAGRRVIPVPVDDEGIDVAAGLKLCPNAKVAFVTPSHQYPLGFTMSAARRLQLLAWAQASGAWIVEDDYDSEYRYDSMPIVSLQGLDLNSRVIYIGTFSKTLFPSLRLGYLVIPPDLVDRFAAVRRVIDVCPPQLYQAVLADFIRKGHYARHIRKMRLLYNERRTVLVGSIQDQFGSLLEISGDAAGMHIATITPQDWDDREIAARAARRNLWLWPLSTAYLGDNRQKGFILGFGGVAASDIPQAVSLMRRVAREAL